MSTPTGGPCWLRCESHRKAKEVGTVGLGSRVGRKPTWGTKFPVSRIPLTLYYAQQLVSRWGHSQVQANEHRPCTMAIWKTITAQEGSFCKAIRIWQGPTDKAPSGDCQALLVIKNARQLWGALAGLEFSCRGSLPTPAPNEQSRFCCYFKLS